MLRLLFFAILLNIFTANVWSFEAWHGDYNAYLGPNDGSDGGENNPPKDCGVKISVNINDDKVLIDIFSDQNNEYVTYKFDNINKGPQYSQGMYRGRRTKIHSHAAFSRSTLGNTIEIKEHAFFNIFPRNFSHYSVLFIEKKEGELILSVEDHILGRPTAHCTYKKTRD